MPPALDAVVGWLAAAAAVGRPAAVVIAIAPNVAVCIAAARKLAAVVDVLAAFVIAAVEAAAVAVAVVYQQPVVMFDYFVWLLERLHS